MKQTISREELYRLVWQTRPSDLAKAWGISEPTFKKRCQEKLIPLPSASYWTKLRDGKPFVIPKLPPRGPGMDGNVIPWANRNDHRIHYWTDEELLGPIPEAPIFPEALEAIRKRYKAAAAKVDISTNFERPHHAIRKLLAADEERHRLQSKRTYVSDWDGPRFMNPFEQRRLKLLNAIMLMSARIGATVNLHDQWGRGAVITINDQTLALDLDSAGNLKSFDRYRVSKTPPDEPLILRIKESHWGGGEPLHEWTGSDDKLERKIREISVEFIVEAEALYRRSCERKHARRIEAKASRIKALQAAKEKAEKEEIKRQAQLRQERIDHLLDLAGDHHKAQTIRALVESATANRELDEQGAAWRAWALGVAADIDPVSNGRVWECR